MLMEMTYIYEKNCFTKTKSTTEQSSMLLHVRNLINIWIKRAQLNSCFDFFIHSGESQHIILVKWYEEETALHSYVLKKEGALS